MTFAPAAVNGDPDKVADLITPLKCSAQTAGGSVHCGSTTNLAAKAGSRDFVGGQNTYVKLTSNNVTYDTGTETFQFDVTVQNLLREAIGTPNGVVPAVNGIQVFFETQPVATAGSGSISVDNADGTGTFLASNTPYYQYTGILAQNAVSSAKTWQFHVPVTVTAFEFYVYLSTDVQPLLVINELLANPGGTISDANGEWIEIYNAGTLSVEMQGLVMADSAASGRRPYAFINSSLPVASGGYVVLGNTTNTTNNGGVPVDYAYGAAMGFANSLDAFKLSRVYGTDTLTLDRTQYASAAVSAQNGISRELKNPYLDNSNMDGSNWTDASVSSVYGPGGRGTPKAQNAGFTP